MLHCAALCCTALHYAALCCITTNVFFIDVEEEEEEEEEDSLISAEISFFSAAPQAPPFFIYNILAKSFQGTCTATFFTRNVVQRSWELLFLGRTIRHLSDFLFSGPGNSYSSAVRFGIWVVSGSAILGIPIPGSYGSGFG